MNAMDHLRQHPRRHHDPTPRRPAQPAVPGAHKAARSPAPSRFWPTTAPRPSHEHHGEPDHVVTLGSEKQRRTCQPDPMRVLRAVAGQRGVRETSCRCSTATGQRTKNRKGMIRAGASGGDGVARAARGRRSRGRGGASRSAPRGAGSSGRWFARNPHQAGARPTHLNGADDLPFRVSVYSHHGVGRRHGGGHRFGRHLDRVGPTTPPPHPTLGYLA